MPDTCYRDAGPADAAAIARLHATRWQEAYATLAPPAAREALDEAHRRAGWDRTLAEGKGRTIVAEEDGRLAGFVHLGPASQPELGEAGEIKHLYVAAEASGRGTGTALLRQALATLAEDGHRTATLAVVEGNDGALRLYRRLGGTEVGGFVDAGPLWRSRNRIVRFDLGAVPA